MIVIVIGILCDCLCYWDDIHLIRGMVERGVGQHERPLFDPGLPIVCCRVYIVLYNCVVWYDVI